MGRPKKTKINLNKNSLQDFMQEIYNDCVNVMNSARKELNERKSRAEIEDINDESMIGKVNNDTLKIIEGTIDRKLALAKLQSQIVETDNKDTETTTNDGGSLSDDDKSLLRDLFKEQKEKNNIDYDLD
tara:strand:+ start:3887 stop:4273 length:387 start_codon:yes stop_codon:yes gene_type:complete